MGRTYTLGNVPLPAKIETGETELLADPLRLVLAGKEGTRKWEDAIFRLERQQATHALFRFSASNDVARLHGTLRAEYDGFLLYDIELEPATEGTTVEGLSLEIPLWRKQTHFLRASRVPIDRWAAPEKIQHALIGDVRDDIVPEGFAPGYSPQGWNWGDAFIPQFWVGDDHRGLWYFQDTPEGMHWEGSPLEVVEQGEKTLLRYHFINRPISLSEPLRYRFALQATPVRKRERRLERLCYGFQPLWEIKRPELHADARGLVQGAVLWDFGRVEKDYRVTNPEELRTLVADWRADGVEVLLNIGSGFYLEGEPEYQLYGPEWIQEPPVRYPNLAGTDVSLVKVCPQSSFPDYFLWWLEEMIEEYDVGGIYLDLSGPTGCGNPYHGCGRNGETTAEMFDCREFYKRCYTFLKEEGAKRGREFYIFQHSAEGIVTTFVGMMTKGEGWIQADTFEALRPTYFRAAESWRHLGDPFEGEIRIDRDGLGLPGGMLPVREILSGDQVELSTDVLPVRVDAKSLKVLWVNK
jgi:hypothetical protein